MTANLFLLFCLAWFGVIAFCLFKFLSRRAAMTVLVGLALWLGYTGMLAHRGLLLSTDLPPRFLLLLIPMLLYTLWLCRSKAALVLAQRMPLRLLVGLQAFRVIVELFLDQLWRAGLLPQGMTWHGHNFDILTGVTAGLLYAMWPHFPKTETAAKSWNYLGLALLAQVAITGVLSAPGPQHLMNHAMPNRAIMSFPYVYIASLFVFSALSLHVLALRKIFNEAKSSRE